MTTRIAPSPHIVLADDHPIMRQGLSYILSEGGFEVASQVGDGLSLVELVKNARPDIAIVDITMPEIDGLEAAERLMKESPRTKVIFLTMHPNRELVRRAYRLGASGYVLKESAPSQLVDAIHVALHGGFYLSSELAGLAWQPRDEQDESTTLNKEEREILRAVWEGQTTKEIGQRLHISAKDAETALECIMTKLGVDNVAQLMKYVISENLLATDGPEFRGPAQTDTSRRRGDPALPAFAQVVGMFCHDLRNSVSAAGLSLEETRKRGSEQWEATRSLVRTAERKLKDLHEFVYQYYKMDTVSPWISGAEVKEALRALIGVQVLAGVTLQIELPGITEATLIHKVVLYTIVPLVENALDAIHSRGCRQERPRITISVQPFLACDGVNIVVSDTGPGWQGNLDRLRSSLEADERFSTKDPDRGFGLPNVYKLVQKLGGRMDLDEARPQGARVEIRLPKEFINDKA